MKKLGFFLVFCSSLCMTSLSADLLESVKQGDIRKVKTLFTNEEKPYGEELADAYVYAFYHGTPEFLDELQAVFQSHDNSMLYLLMNLQDEKALKHLCKKHKFSQQELDATLHYIFRYYSSDPFENRLEVGQILMDAGASPQSGPSIFDNAWTGAAMNWETDALELFLKQPSFDKDWARTWYLNVSVDYMYRFEIQKNSLCDDGTKELLKFINQCAKDYGFALTAEQAREIIVSEKVECSRYLPLIQSQPWNFSLDFLTKAMMDYIVWSEADDIFFYSGCLDKVSKRLSKVQYDPEIVARRIVEDVRFPKTIVSIEDGDTYHETSRLIPIHFYAVLLQDENVEDLVPKEITEKILKLDVLFMQLNSPSGELVQDWIFEQIESYLEEAK